MDERSAKMIAEGDAKRELEAAERAARATAETVIDVAPTKGEPDGGDEGLEIVRPMPAEDPSAYR